MNSTHVRRIAVFPLLWWSSGTIFLLFMVSLLVLGRQDRVHYVAISWITAVLVLTVLGNWLISRRLDTVFSWQDQTAARFWVQTLLGTLFALLCINITYFLAKRLFLDINPDRYQFLVLNVYGLFVIAPLILVYGILYVMMQWRRSMVYSEELKQENIRSSLESLRNHLDPHFLFNNLNILSSLIDKDPYAAQDFLAAFSEVYRYVLQSRGEELVPLHREMEFVDAYVYMLRQRFRDNIDIRVEIAPQARRRFIPPLSVQPLIENAIKHNRATDSLPLPIHIEADGDALTVRNRLQRKSEAPVGSGFGLANLHKRYAYLSDKAVQVRETDDEFSVTLPLLSLESS
ncbi:MAG: hypothetical protein OHK0039_00880 [Bacteroidia bacterium]